MSWQASNQSGSTSAGASTETMSRPPPPQQQQQSEGGSGNSGDSSSSSDSLLSRGLASVNASTQAVSDRVTLELRSRQAQLLAAEKEVRGRLWSEYEAQVRELEPTLRLRGQMVGEALIETMFSPSAASVSYGETLERSLKNTAAERLPVREVVQSLDPLITPILNPFVEGLQAPFSKEFDKAKMKVLAGWVATGLLGLAAGFALGRLLPRGDGQKRR